MKKYFVFNVPKMTSNLRYYNYKTALLLCLGEFLMRLIRLFMALSETYKVI